MDTEYDFIVNPKASSGMGEMIWKMLEPELKKRRVVYRVHMTRKRGHAAEIAKALTLDGSEHTVVVLGGDGTVNETVNGICFPEKATLGYIPTGSGNDFARGLGLPKEPLEALGIILRREKTIHMDIGVLSGKKSRRFLVSAGMGFDAAVCHEVCVSHLKVLLNKIGLGKLSYAAVALDRLIKGRPVRLALTLTDGETKVFEKTYFAAFMNLPYEGGGFKFTPKASPEDGLLDVVVVHGLSLPKVIFLLLLASGGKHVGFKGVSVLRCTGLKAEAETALPLHTDGEPGFLRKEIMASVLGEKLNVIVG